MYLINPAYIILSLFALMTEGSPTNVISDSCKGESSRFSTAVFHNMSAQFCSVAPEKTANFQKAWSAELAGTHEMARLDKSGVSELMNWHMFYHFTPKGVNGTVPQCTTSCGAALGVLEASKCGRASENGTMAKKASIEFPCGIYRYEITELSVKPPPETTTTSATSTTTTEEPPKATEPPLEETGPILLGEQKCHAKGAFGKQQDVEWSEQARNAGILCDKFNGFGPGKKSLKSNYGPYYYSVRWIAGCEIKGVKTQNPMAPIPGNTEITCSKLWTDNYQQCNNGGAGGWRTAGCLWYEYKPKE